MAAIEKRTNKGGGISFRVKIRLKGFPQQTASFARLTDARRWAQDTESAIRAGRYFRHSEARKHTLNQLLDRYIKEVLPSKPRTLRSQRMQLLWWKARIGHTLLADVTPALLVEQREFLASEELKRLDRAKTFTRSPATVNRYLAALSHAFSLGVNEWQWIDSNPLRKVKKKKESRGRVRFLSDEERVRLLEACKASANRHLYAVVVLALATGARKSELLNLRWSDIDFLRGRIVVHESKNGERRALPLTGHALETLKAHARVRRIDSELLFPNLGATGPVDIRTAWENTLEKANIVDFRFHDLRHSAASYLAMSGSSLAVIAETLGHKTLAMVKRYAHLTESHISTEVERMNRKIFQT